MKYLGIVVALAAVAFLEGCDQHSATVGAAPYAVACQARPSDEKILTALNTALGKRVSIIGVTPACNSATVMYDDGNNHWEQVGLTGFDNGVWVLAHGNSLTGVSYFKIE
jgi:hypothetical protein